MGPIHDAGRVERVFRVIAFLHDAALVFPIIEVLRGIKAHPMMPMGAAFPRRHSRDAFLVLTIPIIGAIRIEDRSPVGLDELAFDVIEEFAGSERLIHGIVLVSFSLSSSKPKAKQTRRNNLDSNIDT